MYFANINDYTQYVSSQIYNLSFSMERLDKYVKTYQDLLKTILSFNSGFRKVSISGMEFKLDYSIRFDLSIRDVEEPIRIYVPATNGKEYPKTYIDAIEVEFRDERKKISLYELEMNMGIFVAQATRKTIRVVSGNTEYSFEVEADACDENAIMTRVNNELNIKSLSDIVFKNLLEYMDYQQNYVEYNGFAYYRDTKVYSNNTLIFSAI